MRSQTNSDGICVLYTDIAAALRLAAARGRRVDPRFNAKINIIAHFMGSDAGA